MKWNNKHNIWEERNETVIIASEKAGLTPHPKFCLDVKIDDPTHAVRLCELKYLLVT